MLPPVCPLDLRNSALERLNESASSYGRTARMRPARAMEDSEQTAKCSVQSVSLGGTASEHGLSGTQSHVPVTRLGVGQVESPSEALFPCELRKRIKVQEILHSLEPQSKHTCD